MKGKLSLFSFKVKNFKAVQDRRTIKVTPLTVFIGNNGSGKSRTLTGHIRTAFTRSKSFEHSQTTIAFVA
jgi:predicted ATPase